MVDFVRTKTFATREVATRNLRLAGERAARGKEMGLTGEILAGYILGLRVKDETMSLRAYIAWSILAAGVGTYTLEDIRENANASGVYDKGEVSIAQVRAAVTSYLVPRAFESQPYFAYSFAYDRGEGTVTLSRLVGAKAALEAGKARKPRKVAEVKAELAALPAPIAHEGNGEQA